MNDQHGTAIVVLAGIINALRVTGKQKETCRVVVNGAGSAGVAITKPLLTYGFSHITMCDINGTICKIQPSELDAETDAEMTNPDQIHGTLADALKGADIFIGVSAPNIVTAEMVSSMNKDSILFAMANPVPEIMPDLRGEESQIGPYSAVRLRFPAWHGNPARDVRLITHNHILEKRLDGFQIAGHHFRLQIRPQRHFVYEPLDKFLIQAPHRCAQGLNLRGQMFGRTEHGAFKNELLLGMKLEKALPDHEEIFDCGCRILP